MKTDIPELNLEIADFLKARAAAMEKKSSDKFKALAYHRAARAVGQEPRNLWGVFRSGGLSALQKIEGIGPRLAWVIIAQLKKTKPQ